MLIFMSCKHEMPKPEIHNNKDSKGFLYKEITYKNSFIPDTIVYYWENGNVNKILVKRKHKNDINSVFYYDSLGILLSQECCSENNSIKSFSLFYWKNGKIKTVSQLEMGVAILQMDLL